MFGCTREHTLVLQMLEAQDIILCRLDYEGKKSAADGTIFQLYCSVCSTFSFQKKKKNGLQVHTCKQSLWQAAGAASAVPAVLFATEKIKNPQQTVAKLFSKSLTHKILYRICARITSKAARTGACKLKKKARADGDSFTHKQTQLRMFTRDLRPTMKAKRPSKRGKHFLLAYWVGFFQG